MVFSKCLTSGFESFSTITAVKVAISVLRLPGTRVAFQMHEVEQQGPRWRFASEMLPSRDEVEKRQSCQVSAVARGSALRFVKNTL